MVILVTNDDGDSPGLRMLLGIAREFGRAYAIIPTRQRSAVSGALTLHKPIRLHKLDDGLFAINGTPADCVLFSLYSGEFEKPDLVLSGINWGENSGLGPLLGSGTVGACWQSALENVPAIAFSIVKGKGDWRHKSSWGNEDILKKRVAGIIRLLRPKLKNDAFFNVNMPHDPENAKLIYTMHLQKEQYHTKIEKRTDPSGRTYFWIYGQPEKTEKDTDFYEVAVNGNISITEISLSVFERKCV